MDDKRNNQTSAPELGDLTRHSGDRQRSSTLPKIILASASPRRAQILRTVNWPFETLPLNIDETREPGEDAPTYVQRLARAKAETAALRSPSSLIVGADTTVLLGDPI